MSDTEIETPRRRRRAGSAVAAGAVGAVVLLLVVVLATSDPATDRIAKSPLVGRPVPPIDAPTTTGGTVDVGRYEGQWLLVNFFATWCGPCRREHPELVRFAEEGARDGSASVLSVVFQDDPEAVAEFFADKGGDWPIVRDADGRTTLDFGVAKLPESYLVGPDGIVRAKITGGVSADGLQDVIAELEGGAGG